jgi:PAS domain S-box-containing protein
MKTDNRDSDLQNSKNAENSVATDLKTEDALRKSEEKYRMLFESSRDALMTLAPPSWKFTSANHAAQQLFGVASETEFTMLGPWDVSPKQQPDGHPSVVKAMKMIDTAMREGSHFFEWEHKRLHGDPFTADVLLTRMEVDGRISMQATVRDITERKQAERMLRASEERHRLILGTAMDGFWLVDTKGHILEVNEAYCRMSGYSQQELLNMSIPDLEGAEHPADTEAHIRKIVLEGEERFESAHRRKDGSTFVVEVSTQYKPIEGGRIVGFIRDRTARKRAEDRIRESEEKLRIRTQELEEMNSTLKVLLKQREQDQKDIELKMRVNVKQLVLPYIEKLKKRRSGEDAAYLNIIEENLYGVMSSFASTTSSALHRLTPQEILVANFIKAGKQDKDISALLNLSIHTIKAHRRNIRKKLGLTNGKSNLRTFLSDL